jgi:hypothetical protein
MGWPGWSSPVGNTLSQACPRKVSGVWVCVRVCVCATGLMFMLLTHRPPTVHVPHAAGHAAHSAARTTVVAAGVVAELTAVNDPDPTLVALVPTTTPTTQRATPEKRVAAVWKCTVLIPTMEDWILSRSLWGSGLPTRPGVGL